MRAIIAIQIDAMETIKLDAPENSLSASIFK